MLAVSSAPHYCNLTYNPDVSLHLSQSHIFFLPFSFPSVVLSMTQSPPLFFSSLSSASIPPTRMFFHHRSFFMRSTSFSTQHTLSVSQIQLASLTHSHTLLVHFACARFPFPLFSHSQPASARTARTAESHTHSRQLFLRVEVCVTRFHCMEWSSDIKKHDSELRSNVDVRFDHGT